MMSVPSLFLMELPLEEMEVLEVGLNAWPNTDWLRDDGRQVDDAPVATEHHQDENGEDFDISFDPSSFEQAPTTKTAPSKPALTTAAELAAGGANMLPPVSPEAFFAGMVVRHPDYGLGKIIALSGGRGARKATVAFTSGAGQRTFVLAQSPLRPVK
jgi:DNA helicase-2/ATP-dependent DNA helicase PcrA